MFAAGMNERDQLESLDRVLRNSQFAREIALSWMPARAFATCCLMLALIAGLAPSAAWALEAPRFHWTLSPAERARLIFLQGIAAVYVFTLGAVLGSFLNVVIYRLPRGLNIVRPRSRCPACATPIQMRDNLPVLGWLLLRGKCRICGGPISPRYPLVEAAIGTLLLLLCWLQVRLGGVNLPNWTPTPLDDLMILSWQMPWGNFLIVFYHAWLLVTLFVATLIQADGFRVPGVIVRLALAIGLLLPLAWPWLRPLATWGNTTGTGSTTPFLDGLTGGIAGLAAGGLLSFLPARSGHGSRRSLIYALLLIGVFLGWQAAIALASICLIPLLLVGVFLAESRALPRTPLVWPMLAAWVYVPLWRFAVAFGDWLLAIFTNAP